MTGGLGFGKPKDGKPSGKNSRQFFETVLDAAGTGNQERVYRLLDENEDKLNDNFAQLVRQDADVKLRNPRQLWCKKTVGQFHYLEASLLRRLV
jgi:hypothetical protein